jgi:glycosyltransferase involved in cell wall biosynthesis
MSHGAPVVTSQSSALPEVAGDAAILVDPFDPEAIAEALLRFAGNADLRDDFARRGIEHARGFTWESAVEQTWRVYNEIR